MSIGSFLGLKKQLIGSTFLVLPRMGNTLFKYTY